MHFLSALKGMGVLVFTVLVVILDQITKLAVKARFYLGESIEIFGDTLRFTYIQNPGMAFGIRFGGKLFFTVFASIASLIILIYLYRMRQERFQSRFSLALILGGAIGNLIDRFAYGEVIDFIDIGVESTRWPVFNIADSAVTVGMIILISLVLFERDKSEQPSPPAFPAQQPAPSDEQDNWRDAQHRN
ncbi:MAG: signal peptidase II [bacterium]